MRFKRAFLTLGIGLLTIWFGLTASKGAPQSPYREWSNGPPTNADYFPIAVWLQNPKNAERYRTAGINLYVGLWRGPTAEQLEALRKAGMRVICGQNAFALSNKSNPVIAGWMHNDEPDNAQSLGRGKGYGPPVLPSEILRLYEKMRAADPTRPVVLNLGQGVAWDNYIGRGVRRNHPEDYAEYLKGCDIASFDIYPAVHSDKAVAGKLEFVANGVKRLVDWTGRAKPVWNCIECTHIENPDVKPTPAQVRAEVWMSLINGSGGLIYFVHQFKPTFQEAALLEDPEMLAAVTAINRRIHALAPVLNSSTADKLIVTSGNTRVASLLKRHEGATYLFTVSMQNTPGHATFTSSALANNALVEVLDENRAIPVRENRFSDSFKPYAVHLYRIRAN
ncbi:MAG: hypothetical protein L0Y58_05865 [Verrucomicrobia subdivision 3 bacterium]|nr:hypothetical protein [Limisphaerales bacterium]